MTIEEMDKLEPGSLVKSKANKYIYVVIERCGPRLALIAQEKMICPDEWELVKDEPKKEATFDHHCPWCGQYSPRGIYDECSLFLMGFKCDRCEFKIEVKKGFKEDYRTVFDTEWLNKLTNHMREKVVGERKMGQGI